MRSSILFSITVIWIQNHCTLPFPYAVRSWTAAAALSSSTLTVDAGVTATAGFFCAANMSTIVRLIPALGAVPPLLEAAAAGVTAVAGGTLGAAEPGTRAWNFCIVGCGMAVRSTTGAASRLTSTTSTSASLIPALVGATAGSDFTCASTPSCLTPAGSWPRRRRSSR